MITPQTKIKCPKCDTLDKPEETRRWGTKVEIYCNTCGMISIVVVSDNDS